MLGPDEGKRVSRMCRETRWGVYYDFNKECFVIGKCRNGRCGTKVRHVSGNDVGENWLGW